MSPATDTEKVVPTSQQSPLQRSVMSVETTAAYGENHIRQIHTLCEQMQSFEY